MIYSAYDFTEKLRKCVISKHYQIYAHTQNGSALSCRAVFNQMSIWSITFLRAFALS